MLYSGNLEQISNTEYNTISNIFLEKENVY